MKRNDYGFPMPEELERAQAAAAEIRARNFPAPCNCDECVLARNLPGVLRILANWQPKDHATQPEGIK